MEILFTVSGAGTDRDVWLDADPATPFSVLSDALEPGTASGPARVWWDGERPLRPDAPVGSEVLEGAVLSHRPPAPVPAWAEAGDAPGVTLLAVGGPHAGRSWRLAPGEYVVGRSDEAAINLVDDLEVSRAHALLVVGPDRVGVRDLGSAHGTRVEGQPISDTALDQGAYIQLGGTVLTWRAGEVPRGSVVRNGEGGLVFNRPPRLVPPPGAGVVRYPGPAPIAGGVNFPLLATIAPVILGVVLAVVVHNVLYLLFTFLAPVIGISNWLSQRRSGVKSHRERLRAYRAAVEAADAELRSALAAETVERRAAGPDPATLAQVADGPQTSLWERRRSDPDFLSLRIGLSDRPSRIVVEGRADPDRADVATGPAVVRLVPSVVDLQSDGVLGVAGGRRVCESLVSGLLLQAAVLHAPEDLVITILTGPHQREAWSWTRWLPHLRDREGRFVARVAANEPAIARMAAELSALIDERLSANRAGEEPAHLVIVDGAYQISALPAVTKILRRGREAGVVAICIDDAERLLPEECRAVAVFSPDRTALVRVRTGRQAGMEVLADLIDTDVAETVARRLAPLRLNRRIVAGAAIPASVRLLDLLDLDPPTPPGVTRFWQAGGRSTGAVVGLSETGPMSIDLAKDGPHGLVAGTTGSGKSELLQTLIASLAVVNRPDQMNFVLVDYKGGSAFKECSRLVHTVGMVTDLDGHLTERALASIGAELRRREVVLGQAGAKDIEAYWRLAGPDQPTLGRLLIVIDEFASLVEELPSFVDGLVDLARRGRSLGIHLILATQRPSGVVSAAIKTNTNLRVAMRVTDAADSVDVIDSPRSARIAKSSPGRGYARVGHDDLTEFQAARIGGRRPRRGGPSVGLREVTFGELAEPITAAGPAEYEGDTTDLAVLVDAINEAAIESGVPAPKSPWLPALPESLTLDPVALRLADGDGPAAALFGVEDLPEMQAQRMASYDLTKDGHLFVIGDPGSGRSTLLRTLGASLAARNRPADVHIYGIDCGNGALLPLEAFPHVGAVVTRREADRIDRLVAQLLGEITARQQHLARRGFATIADQRALVPVADRLSYIVVLLDRWEGFNAEFETLDGGRLVTALMHLMREGPGVGVRFVVTADRSGTTPRFASLAERILMLRLNDRTVYSILGLNPRFLPDVIGPGRGFYSRGGTEVQVGLLADDPSGPAQVAEVERLAAHAREEFAAMSEDRLPDPIAVLPLHVPLEPLLDRATPPGHGPVALVGVGSDRLAPVNVDLGASGPGFVVSGPPRSGRSTALIAIARSVAQNGGRVFGIWSRPSPIITLAGRPGVADIVDGNGLGQQDLTDLIMRAGAKGLTVIVDDAELLAEGPVSEVLTAFLKAARDNRSALVLSGASGELNQFRGFVPEARKSKTGLLLCPPAATEGDLLGVRLPRTALFSGPPGRGLFVRNGEMAAVQVPIDDFQDHRSHG